MVIFQSLALLARARAFYVSLGVLTYILYPRFAVYQIAAVRYNTLSMNLFQGIDLELDVLLDVYVSQCLRKSPCWLVERLDAGLRIL